jgi:hypothetical protein
MLVIRREQMDLFRERAVRHFEADMLEWLETAFPADFLALGADAAAALVHRGIRAALGHGIETEIDIKLFLTLKMQLGDEFESLTQEEDVVRLLADPDLTGHERAQLLFYELTGELPEG